ncbi:hypothetical protein CDIK_2865 [Cucumispora dikerogammari]|nr:hypothetical protein CDIK_2865 [Cucumispora dikerogammari]
MSKKIKRYTTRNKEVPIMMCTFRKCGKKQQSIRKDSVFFKIKAPLSKIILVIYEWSQFTSLKNIKKKYGVGIKLINTIIDIFKQQFKKMKKTKIGGPNEVIEVDETALSTTKYNTDRRFEQIWCIERICRRTKNVFYKLSRKRTQKVMNELMTKRVEKNTTIVTDGWKGYENLKKQGFAHHTICHKTNFVNLENPNIHTQNIEVYWRYLKKYIKSGSLNNKKRLKRLVASYVLLKTVKNDFQKLLV